MMMPRAHMHSSEETGNQGTAIETPLTLRLEASSEKT